MAGVSGPSEEGITWAHNAPLHRLNSMGLEARARLLATVASEEGLIRFLEWAQKTSEKFVVLGRGTNVIFAEKSLDAVILHLNGDFARFTMKAQEILAGAAALLARLLQNARKANLSGLEGAWGIPGTLGGALTGNAGTADWTIRDCVEWVEVFDSDGIKQRLTASEIGFEYRRSTLATLGVITQVSLALRADSRNSIEARIRRAQERRRSQPRGRSAGCVFKNPPGDSAGRLIDAAGLKGLRHGGAVVSSEHANFIINEGGATGSDIMELIEEIRRRVYERFQILLEEEVLILRSSKS